MNMYLSSDYVLINDIDASDTSSWNNGAGFEPVGDSVNKFTGSLDGQGYEITDLYINRPVSGGGLFGNVGSAGIIEDVGLIDLSITFGSDDVGGIAGYNEGQINQCYISGDVEGGFNTGGLVGNNVDGTVNRCIATGNVTGGLGVGGLVGRNEGKLNQCYANSIVTGSGNVAGGLAGYNFANLTQCYATGNVTGNSHVGGLVGYNYEFILQCYATGNVTGDSHVGGLAGSNIDTVSLSYWDTETTGLTISAGSNPSYGKTTAEMKRQSTYVDWDFNDVWNICNDVTAS